MSDNQTLNITDINNPPRSPYAHQEFPKLIYRKPAEGQHPNDAHRLVSNQDEEEKLLVSGYAPKPYSEEAEPVQEAPKPKKGRKFEAAE